MGYAHLISVHEDGIRKAKQHPEEAPKYADAVGEAVLKLCLDPDMMQTPEGLQPVTSTDVFNHGGCINHAAKLHSTDEQIFVWAGNCLRTLDQMSDEDLEGVRRLFDDLVKKRINRDH